MSSQRTILAVLLSLAMAGCAGTGAPDQPPVDSADGIAEAGQDPIFTPVAKRRSAPPAKPQPALAARANAAGGKPGTGAKASKPRNIGGKANAAPVTASGTAANAMPPTPASPSGGAGDIASANAGDETEGPDQPAAQDTITGMNGADGATGSAVLADQSDEPDQVAAFAPGDRGAHVDSAQDAEPADLTKVLRKPSFEERTLKCDVVQLMGEAIGRRRIRGEERKPATDRAIEDVLIQTGGTRDKRFVFSGRVYGMLIYRLKADHTASGLGAYAHAACLILRGRKGIVPADKISEQRLDEALTVCETGSPAPGGLNACILDRMEEIVRQRAARSD